MGYSWGNVFQLPRLLVSWHISDCHSFWVQRRSKKLWKKKPRKNPKSLLWLTVLLAGYQTRWSPEVPSIPRDSVTVILQILCSEYTYVQISFLNKYIFFCRRNCDCVFNEINSPIYNMLLLTLSRENLSSNIFV